MQWSNKKLRIRSSLGLISIVVLGLLTAVDAAAQYSPEERIVRQAYAKLSFYQKIGLIAKWSRKEFTARVPESHTVDLAARYEGDRLLFELSAFQVGDIHEVLDSPLGSLVSPPTDTPLQITVGEQVRNTPSGNVPEGVFMEAKWSTAPPVPAELWAAATLGEGLRANGIVVSTGRYAKYDVALRFQGKRRTYSAMFLFAAPGTFVAPGRDFMVIDNIVTGGGLFESYTETVYPSFLMSEDFRLTPTFRAFEESEAAIPIGPQGCAAELVKEGICCDLETLKCRLNIRAKPDSNSLSPNSAAAAPIRAAGGGGLCSLFDDQTITADYAQSSTMHISGYHSALTTFDKLCTYRDVWGYHGCKAYCKVTVDEPETSDSGVVIPFPLSPFISCHRAYTKKQNGGADGVYPAQVNCEGKAVVAWEHCWGCICTPITITIPPVGVTYDPAIQLQPEYEVVEGKSCAAVCP